MNKRNPGIELLRIVSMIYVIVLHTLGQGGILANSIAGSSHFYAGWAIEVFAFCAVNIFGIISGYVKYDDNKEYHFKLRSYLNLWLQVAFYNVVVAVILIYTNTVPNEGYFTMFFPLTTNAYWYFTAFTGVIVISPLIDLGLRAMSKKQAFVLMIVLFVLISFFGTIAPVFCLEDGYSVIWLLVCYIIGSIIKKVSMPNTYTMAGFINDDCCIRSIYSNVYEVWYNF
ncbi:acyltransferase family protein [Anaerovoracaceae bacterium SGI.195]